MKHHDFEIEQFDKHCARVKIDGKEMQGVKYVNYEIGVGDAPEITIRFMTGTLNFKNKIMSAKQMLNQVQTLNSGLGGKVRNAHSDLIEKEGTE